MNLEIVAFAFGAIFACLMGFYFFIRARKLALAHWRRRLGMAAIDQAELLKDAKGKVALVEFLDETGLGWSSTHFIQWTITGGSLGIIGGALTGEAPLAVMLGL